MNRTLAATALLALAFLAGCTSTTTYGSTSNPSPSPTAASATTGAPAGLAVGIAGFAFSPAALQIAPGDTVTWTNHDTTAHTVTADDGSFDSGPIAPGATYTHTFSGAGVVAYHCSIHTTMKGTLTVLGTSGSPSSASSGAPSMPSMPSAPSMPSSAPAPSPGYP